MWLDNRGVVITWVSVWVWVSVLCWGGRVQELGSDAYKCEDALPNCVYCNDDTLPGRTHELM